MKKQNLDSELKKIVQESSLTINSIVELIPDIEKAIHEIVKCISKKNKIILFGNGGSAADAQHIAAEFIGRFKIERKGFPAIALITDSSCITALSNDYSFDIIFSRQCESLVQKGDIVIGISTSGKSKNILNGFKTAKERGAISIGLLGNKGGKIGKSIDIPIIVNSSSTARIQDDDFLKIRLS